jgi:hypothetical protein
VAQEHSDSDKGRIRQVSTVVERGGLVVGQSDRWWTFEVETGRPIVVSERVVVNHWPVSTDRWCRRGGSRNAARHPVWRSRARQRYRL